MRPGKGPGGEDPFHFCVDFMLFRRYVRGHGGYPRDSRPAISNDPKRNLQAENLLAAATRTADSGQIRAQTEQRLFDERGNSPANSMRWPLLHFGVSVADTQESFRDL
jgi:hypothetical protein